MSIYVGDAANAPKFQVAAKALVGDTQVRHNVRHATGVIRKKRAIVVGEMPDWEQLRESGHQIKRHVMRHLDFYLDQFEKACTNAGGTVHWARDADEANNVIVGLVKAQHAI
jgi:L-lactate dehydrogenase complex protein LldF